jgi:hypothetical protein
MVFVGVRAVAQPGRALEPAPRGADGDAVEVYPRWASFKPAQATDTEPSQVQILLARPNNLELMLILQN